MPEVLGQARKRVRFTIWGVMCDAPERPLSLPTLSHVFDIPHKIGRTSR
jgi:hypothetical protein